MLPVILIGLLVALPIFLVGGTVLVYRYYRAKAFAQRDTRTPAEIEMGVMSPREREERKKGKQRADQRQVEPVREQRRDDGFVTVKLHQ